MTKGNAIRFVGGIYVGQTGWIDAEKKETPKQVSVIVDLGNGKTKRTRVNKESVEKPSEAPSCYAEAVMQQCPDIEKRMNKLCSELAKCKIAIDAWGIMEILNEKLHKATKKQASMGSKATYRQVVFTIPSPAGSENV